MIPSIPVRVRFSSALGLGLLAASASSALACGLYGFEPLEPPPSGRSDQIEQVILSIETVPTDVRCIRVSATGEARTESRTIDATGGTALTQSLSGLPLGTVTFLGEAFDQACSGVRKATVAGWVSAPVETSIVLGRTARVKLDMARNGRANVDVSWTEEAPCTAEGAACRTNSECCSKSCRQGLCVLAPTAEPPPG